MNLKKKKKKIIGKAFIEPVTKHIRFLASMWKHAELVICFLQNTKDKRPRLNETEASCFDLPHLMDFWESDYCLS